MIRRLSSAVVVASVSAIFGACSYMLGSRGVLFASAMAGVISGMSLLFAAGIIIAAIERRGGGSS